MARSLGRGILSRGPAFLHRLGDALASFRTELPLLRGLGRRYAGGVLASLWTPAPLLACAFRTGQCGTNLLETCNLGVQLGQNAMYINRQCAFLSQQVCRTAVQ